jgi:hypothetical protein
VERDPEAAFRRTALVLAILLFSVIAGWNLSNLGAILARAEPHRSLRLAVAASSLSLGTVAVALLVRDLRGGRIPHSIALMPAWLVFGLDLVDSYFFTNDPLSQTGVTAVTVGAGRPGAPSWPSRGGPPREEIRLRRPGRDHVRDDPVRGLGVLATSGLPPGAGLPGWQSWESSDAPSPRVPSGP